jgi:hypothetical protein
MPAISLSAWRVTTRRVTKTTGIEAVGEALEQIIPGKDVSPGNGLAGAIEIRFGPTQIVGRRLGFEPVLLLFRSKRDGHGARGPR